MSVVLGLENHPAKQPPGVKHSSAFFSRGQRWSEPEANVGLVCPHTLRPLSAYHLGKQEASSESRDAVELGQNTQAGLEARSVWVWPRKKV